MSNKQHSLLDELISFLENEREMYGPFSVNVGLKNTQTLSEPDSPDNGQPTQDSADELDNFTNQENASVHETEPSTLDQKLKQCSTLEELKALCETSDVLRTDLENTNLVFGVGNPAADLMIIGEAPGYNEDQQGEPFVGTAGQLLNKILKAIEFDRDDVYIANILKHRPPDNRNPLPEERDRSLPFLERQIDLISPKVILCVGKVSGTTLLDKDEALKNMRGQFYDYRGAKLTVTYHPAALLRNPKWKRPVWEDVQQVRKKYDELDGKP
ncbi:uracil-DNA glycosylase [Rhodohalobacter sp. 8-1]|uniref:uracil-DNA glycosylase n=1 Tax=Rhodohalobacter sp. 8-1 TaxID=3131972 RepID=UPI0030EDF7EA